MFRKIGLFLVLAVELFLGLCYGFTKIGDPVFQALPFIEPISDGLLTFFRNICEGVNVMGLLNVSHKIAMAITVAVVNIIFIIVWFVFFYILLVIIRSIKRHKRRKSNVGPYALSEEEKRRFEWKLFAKRKPIKRIISLIIPLAFIALFVITRFDKNVAALGGAEGFTTFYTDFINPIFRRVSVRYTNSYLDLFFNTGGTGYIELVVKYLHDVMWVEYIILAVAGILILVIWYLIFTLFARIFKKPCAKRRAKIAKRKYILQMENLEYRARKTGCKNISRKAEDALDYSVVDGETAATEIAEIDENNKTRPVGLYKQAAYIDDISTGVTDLGVAPEEEEQTTPLIEREARFVSENDVDIVLEEEPVIEVTEEETPTEVDFEIEEEDPFFEKYQPEDVDVTPVVDYAEKQEVIVEEAPQEVKEEPVIIKQYIEVPSSINEEVIKEEPVAEEEPEPEPEIEEVVVEEPVVEEVKQEVKEPVVEEVVEEVEEEEEEVEEVEEPKVRPDITPIAVVRPASEDLTKKEEKVEIVKPLAFKPKKNNAKSIKPIELSERPKLELKKFSGSSLKVGGTLTPTEAFSTGTTRVAPVIRPLKVATDRPVPKGAGIPVVAGLEKQEQDKFKGAKKKMIAPIQVKKEQEAHISAPKKDVKPLNVDKKALDRKPIKPIKLKK